MNLGVYRKTKAWEFYVTFLSLPSIPGRGGQVKCPCPLNAHPRSAAILGAQSWQPRHLTLLPLWMQPASVSLSLLPSLGLHNWLLSILRCLSAQCLLYVLVPRMPSLHSPPHTVLQSGKFSLLSPVIFQGFLNSHLSWTFGHFPTEQCLPFLLNHCSILLFIRCLFLQRRLLYHLYLGLFKWEGVVCLLWGTGSHSVIQCGLKFRSSPAWASQVLGLQV